MLKGNLTIALFCLFSMFAVILAHGEAKTGILVDASCAESLVKNPSKAGDHLVSCSLQNKESGFGIITKGKFYKFDDYGNEQALLLLKKTDRTKNLILRVEGHFEEGLVKVGAIDLVDLSR